MKLVLLTIATAEEEWSELLREQYRSKISRFISFERKNLRSRAAARDSAEIKIRAESEKILDYLEDRDECWLFDEAGSSLGGSIKFAQEFERSMSSGKPRLILLIGGAYGVSEEVRKRANRRISLSGLTMNHLVAEAVVLEQIYRACTIWKRIPYHNI